MKITKVILLALAIGLINSTFGDPIENGRNFIVPEVRLGEVSLGHNGAETLKNFPKPYTWKSPMQKAA